MIQLNPKIPRFGLARAAKVPHVWHNFCVTRETCQRPVTRMKRLLIDLTGCDQEEEEKRLDLPPLPEELWLDIIVCAVDRSWRSGYGQQRSLIHRLCRVNHQCRRLVMQGLSRVHAIDSSVLGWVNVKKPLGLPHTTTDTTTTTTATVTTVQGLNKSRIQKLSYFNCASPHNDIVSTLTSLSALVYYNRWVFNGNTPRIGDQISLLTSLRSMALVTNSHIDNAPNVNAAWDLFAPRLPGLTELNLTGCSYVMLDNAFRSFTALRSLTLRGNQDVKLVMLQPENAPLYSSLTHLDIGRTPLANWGGTVSKRINGLRSLTCLEDLVVDCNGAKDAISWTQASVARNLKSVTCLTIVEPYTYCAQPPVFPRY